MTSHRTSMLESLCPAKHSCHQFKVHSNVISSPTYIYLLVSCTQVQHVTTGCCKAALQLQSNLIPLAGEVWAYHEASKCWLRVLNLCTCAQMHYSVRYGLKFFILCDITFTKHPTPLPLLLQSSRSVTVPFEKYNSIVQLHMGWCLQVTADTTVWSCNNRARTVTEGLFDFISLPGKIFDR